MFKAVAGYLRCWGGALLGIVLLCAGNLMYQPKAWRESELSVAIPLPAQVLLAGGDRYWAANIGVWRALMVGTGNLSPETLKILAAIQEDVSLLNPGHEDNYYTAAAILPWEGHVASAQAILRRAIDARPFDAYPPFYYAFDQMHFLQDTAGAARVLRDAAARVSDPAYAQGLAILAARWAERGEDVQAAIDTIETMAGQTRDKPFRDYLMSRARRLEGLQVLRNAAALYVERHGRPVTDLRVLVEAGLIDAIPDDPLQGGYAIMNGAVTLNPPKQ